MIITLSGITGVGKSYYKNQIIKNLGLENMVIYTSRAKRKNEINGIDKHFVTLEDINEKLKDKTLFAAYSMCGETYGYDSKYLDENINSVTELHYEWILDFKNKAKNVFSIYIVPNDVERAKKELLDRELPKEVYEERLQEIDEHQKRIDEDRDLRDAFDIVFYNNYDEESKQKLIQLVKDKLNNI